MNWQTVESTEEFHDTGGIIDRYETLRSTLDIQFSNIEMYEIKLKEQRKELRDYLDVCIFFLDFSIKSKFTN